MKKLMTLTLAAAAILFFNFTDPIETYTVDVSESSIVWQGYKVTGSHEGTIELENGSLQMQNGQLIGGNFQIDMPTITVTDLEGGSKAKLEGHLKSDDFFGVAAFPTASFVITKVEAGEAQGTFKVTGNLTIKGITNEINFPASIVEENGQLFGLADIKVDRSKFNVRYGSGSFFDNLGDNTIYDEFDLSVRLAVK
jgi:polyisoprenoid-binding protein YceI